MAGSARTGSRRTAAERLARVARQVLAWEGAGGKRTRVELTLLDAAAMRRLNRRATGRRGLTDVLSFALPQPDGTLLGEVYLCPEEDTDEEFVRLAVHGTLHVLGYDHPEGPGRTRSRMWRRQEDYVRRLLRRGGRGRHR
ncbi:MAG: rRNA maturation RNase YbeY [Gemmatimonadales bacterium]